MYERRDRAQSGLGKGEFFSHRWGDGDGGRAGGLGADEHGMEGSSGWYFALFSRIVRPRYRREEYRRGVEREGDGVGRLLMGCGVDVDGRNFLWVLDFDYAFCSSSRFVSNYTFGKIRFWSLEVDIEV